MKREILFRGVKIDNEELVEGFVYRNEDKHGIKHYFIMEDETYRLSQRRNTIHEIKTDSICEYTGENDIKDVKIFENDKVTSEKWGIEGIVIFDTGCFSVLLTVANCMLWDVGQKPALFEFDDLLVNEAT